jgi:hypothetical protein
VAAVAAGGALAEPLEGPEAANLGGRDDLPGFGHRQDSTSVAGPSGDLDVSARDVVLDGDNPGPVPQMGIAVPRLPCSKLPGHELCMAGHLTLKCHSIEGGTQFHIRKSSTTWSPLTESNRRPSPYHGPPGSLCNAHIGPDRPRHWLWLAEAVPR